MSSWNFPSDFPEDCPPLQAPPANGTYYRIVKFDPPQQSDFVPVYHANQTLAERRIEKGLTTYCETLGLSVYADKNHAIECARQFPKIGEMIAEVTTVSDSGKILHTGGESSSHNTWWVVQGFDPTTIATVVHML